QRGELSRAVQRLPAVTGLRSGVRVPFAHVGDVDGEHRARRRVVAVLRILVAQQAERSREFLARVEDAGAAAQAGPPEAVPVLLEVVDEDRRLRARAGVLDPAQAR